MVLNYIWLSFFLIAFAVAIFKWLVLGEHQIFSSIMTATFDSSKTAFEISLWLTGTLSLWMGLMRIGEKAGIIRVLAKFVNPFFSRIFPEIPSGHPAMAPILLNFSANILGLDNAGTPLGLKAMQEMQKLNSQKDTATNAQIMFLALNTSGLTLIPITIIMYRSQMGATNPADVFIPILLATLCSTIGAFIMVSIYQKIKWDWVVWSFLIGTLLFISSTVYFFQQMEDKEVTLYSNLISSFILFSTIISFLVLAIYRRINAYDAFIEGAKEGFEVAIKIIPYMVAMLVSIAVFRTSGSLTMLVDLISYLLSWMNLDGEFTKALPVAFMKPLSGSGARGMMIDAMQTYGVDSFVGRLACTMQGSTDTTLYIIALYFGSVGIRKTRYAITCGIVADFIGLTSAILVAYIFFT
jgi:spore maturation protein SpmA